MEMEWGGVEAWGIERGAVHLYGVSPYCAAKVHAHSHSLRWSLARRRWQTTSDFNPKTYVTKIFIIS